MNRLQSVEEQAGGAVSFRQAYSYDRWGNRKVDAAQTTGPVGEQQFAVNAANNRLGVPAGQAGVMAYDAAGNLTQDTYTGSGTRAYDAEGRMTSAQFLSGQLQTATYAYDADGRRVKRDAGAAAEVWQVYGIEGELLAEYAAGAAPSAPQKEYGYRAGELLVTLAAGRRVNVALSSNGATASASTTLDANRLPAAAINGDRRGLHYGSDPATGSGWVDASQNAFPDWLEVAFAGSRTIDEIGVIGLQDNYTSSQEPTEAMTGAAYALTAFDVQYWAGSAWATVPGGSVTGNTKVWRKITFPALTTTKVRVLAHGGGSGHSRVVELEAWGAGADARWLVSDHLGTPRMAADAAGQLAGVSRHDYLPFGEEINAGVGGRMTSQGYSQPDGNRKKWATYERDEETALDFAQARYYSPAQGRFTSPDEFTGGPDELFDFVDDAADNPTIYADPIIPQSLNKYQYAYNNPLRYNDPGGHCPMCADAVVRTAQQVGPHAEKIARAAAVTAAAAAAAASGAVEKTWNWLTTPNPNFKVNTFCSVGLDCSGYYMSKARDEAPQQGSRNQDASGSQGDPPRNKPDGGDDSANEPEPVSKKEAVRQAHREVGKQRERGKGKFGSPMRGNSKKGYRLDPPNPKGQGRERTHRHVNWWDYTKGKKGRGGRKGYVPIKDKEER